LRSLPLFVVLASGCATTSFVPEDDAFVLFISSFGQPSSTGPIESTCVENFNDANCRSETPTTSDWTVTSLDSATGPEGFIEVLSGDEGDGGRRVVAVFDGATYDGLLTEDDDVWHLSVSHTAEAIDGSTEDHVSGYSYTERRTDRLTTEMEIDIDAETGTATGSWTATLFVEMHATESDTFTDDLFSQINPNFALDCNQGDCDNPSDEVDCGDVACSVTASATQSSSGTIDGFSVYTDTQDLWTEAGQDGGSTDF
jgi:hypothetical protein